MPTGLRSKKPGPTGPEKIRRLDNASLVKRFASAKYQEKKMATILYVHDVSSFGAQSENVTFPKWGISQKIWRGDDILTTREAPMHIF